MIAIATASIILLTAIVAIASFVSLLRLDLFAFALYSLGTLAGVGLIRYLTGMLRNE